MECDSRETGKKALKLLEELIEGMRMLKDFGVV